MCLARRGWIPTVLALLVGCTSTSEPGGLVPPTADQDAALPSMQVVVNGQALWLHVTTFGESGNPPVFVLPGGPGADFRLLLPLSELKDRYFVVMWDEHGGGLSQRLSHKRDLSLDSFDAEIGAMQAIFAPDRRAALVGHSFGGSIATRYAARHPDAVAALVLVEPGPLTQHARDNRQSGALGGLATLASILWDNEVLSLEDHAQADYRVLGTLREASQDYYCAGQRAQEYPVWRFGAYSELEVTSEENGFDYRSGIEGYHGGTLLVAGSCGNLGRDFQNAFNLPSLPNAEMTSIEGAGHITLFLENAAATLAAIRSFLGQRSW
jgi:proline iminopeptidase